MCFFNYKKVKIDLKFLGFIFLTKLFCFFCSAVKIFYARYEKFLLIQFYSFYVAYKEIFVNMQYDVTKRQYVWDSGEVVEISLFKSHPHQKVEKKQKICVLLIFHHENLSSYFYRQPCNSIVARQKVIPIMCASKCLIYCLKIVYLLN